MNKGLLLPYTVGRWPDTRIAAAVDLQHQRKAIRVWALADAELSDRILCFLGSGSILSFGFVAEFADLIL